MDIIKYFNSGDVVRIKVNLSIYYWMFNINKLFRYSCRYGHLEIVKLLFNDSRVDPSDDDNYAIECAVANNNIQIVKLLLTDSRVINTLSKEKYNVYLKMIDFHS